MADICCVFKSLNNSVSLLYIVSACFDNATILYLMLYTASISTYVYTVGVLWFRRLIVRRLRYLFRCYAATRANFSDPLDSSILSDARTRAPSTIASNTGLDVRYEQHVHGIGKWAFASRKYRILLRSDTQWIYNNLSYAYAYSKPLLSACNRSTSISIYT